MAAPKWGRRVCVLGPGEQLRHGTIRAVASSKVPTGRVQQELTFEPIAPTDQRRPRWASCAQSSHCSGGRRSREGPAEFFGIRITEGKSTAPNSRLGNRLRATGIGRGSKQRGEGTNPTISSAFDRDRRWPAQETWRNAGRMAGDSLTACTSEGLRARKTRTEELCGTCN